MPNPAPPTSPARQTRPSRAEERHLHVVSFDVPWPADYGGVIDVYGLLVALKAAGVRTHLHCYLYHRPPAAELEPLCAEVLYYRRRTGMASQLGRRPYIVQSRRAAQLLARLRHDRHPVLLEGLHNCWLLEQLAADGRTVTVRAHNVEHDYYGALAAAEPRCWKRLFFRIEAHRLRRYEPVLRRASAVIALSSADAQHFRAMGCRVLEAGPFHGHRAPDPRPGRGAYVLYHGNLSVPENAHAARYLMEQVMGGSPVPFVVAGRAPGQDLRALADRLPNVRLVADPDDQTMHRLIAEAQVNLLVTHQPTGAKLKLLNAIYEGRFCVADSNMLHGTELASACVVADTAEAQRRAVESLMSRPFAEADAAYRRRLLADNNLSQEFLDIVLK